MRHCGITPMYPETALFETQLTYLHFQSTTSPNITSVIKVLQRSRRTYARRSHVYARVKAAIYASYKHPTKKAVRQYSE